MDVLEAIHRNRGRAPRPVGAMVTTGYLLAEPDASFVCTVSVHDSEPIRVPAVAGTYTGMTAVRILMQEGRPVQVIGPAGNAPLFMPYAPDAAPGGTLETLSKVILPSATATYRAARGAWRQWGDPADVYQGTSDTGGLLKGLATYGDQFATLGAQSFDEVTVSIPQNPASGFALPWSAVVQGSPHGSIPAGAPTFSGGTVSGTMPGRGSSASVSVALDAGMREALRTGDVRGLGLTGAAYGSTLGIGRGVGSAWAVTVRYTVLRDAPPPALPGDNLIPNPQPTTTTGWSVTSTQGSYYLGSVRTDYAPFNEAGQTSIQFLASVATPDAHTVTTYCTPAGTSAVPVSAGASYALSGYTRLFSLEESAAMGVEWYDAAGALLSESLGTYAAGVEDAHVWYWLPPSPGNESTGWTEANPSATLTAPSGAAFGRPFVRVSATAASGMGNFYVSNVHMGTA